MRISDWSSDVCSSDLRKLLRGFFEGQGIDGDRQLAVLRELDKLDKRGEDAVRATLVGEGFDLSVDVADRLLAFSRVRSTGHDDALAKIDELGAGTQLIEEGSGELRGVHRIGSEWRRGRGWEYG